MENHPAFYGKVLLFWTELIDQINFFYFRDKCKSNHIYICGLSFLNLSAVIHLLGRPPNSSVNYFNYISGIVLVMKLEVCVLTSFIRS